MWGLKQMREKILVPLLDKVIEGMFWPSGAPDGLFYIQTLVVLGMGFFFFFGTTGMGFMTWVGEEQNMHVLACLKEHAMQNILPHCYKFSNQQLLKTKQSMLYYDL